MPTDLRTITTFPQLIRYLGDELDWPVEDYELDELAFDFDPAELGLKDDDAANIKGPIKQLRPLPGGQPWGVFFVEFEKKKLPVVVLRRILSHLVIKKREAANKGGNKRWNADDILFISAFGKEVEREIAFAHFHQESGDLPTLRVLGWDGGDTALTVAHVQGVLKSRLHWPEKGETPEQWRERWTKAFRHRVGHIIRTADSLADVLASLARGIRDAASTLMRHESDKGPLTKLFKAFQASLIHDLTEDSFADTYAQTITYGLLTAAISKTEMSEGRHGTALIADNVADIVPVTNPFLKEMLQTFLKVGGRKGGIDFDELGIQDVVELLRGDETDLPAVIRNFGDRKPGEDPVIHFYETFLGAYNKKLKIQRGVFYTPQPVVSYIVRSVHELLQTEFGLADGLADTTTWGEMLKKHSGLKLPPLTDEPGEKRTISPDEPFVQILDPATGTATFLVEVIDVIHRTLASKWKTNREALPSFSSFIPQPSSFEAYWNAYVPAALRVLDLHGNSNKKETAPDGTKDENVFDISQGVAVSLFLKPKMLDATRSVNLSDLWGSRSDSPAGKYRWLMEHSCRDTSWNETTPTEPLFLFKKSGGVVQHEYEANPSLADVMPLYSMGIKSSRDELVLDFEPAPVLERIERFRSAQISDEAICEQMGVPLKIGWNVAKARNDLRALKQLPPHIRSFLYRPLDWRPLFYHRAVVFSAAYPVMQHLFSGRNLAFVATRQTKDQWDVQCSRALVGHKSLGAYDANSVFPLYLVEDAAESQQTLTNDHRINFSTPFLKSLASVLSLQQKGAHGLPAGLTPEDIFHYAYAVFHSPGYRSRYAEFLKIDFPRLPLTGNLELFRALARLGSELTALHLLEFKVEWASSPFSGKGKGQDAPSTFQPITEFIGGHAGRRQDAGAPVEKISWSRNTVWVDKAQTTGFRGVPEAVWNFHVGGYQVCEKWLKDRKGRTLTNDDLAHYQKIVVALSETIRLMKEIDPVIEKHGGWPGAFQTAQA